MGLFRRESLLDSRPPACLTHPRFGRSPPVVSSAGPGDTGAGQLGPAHWGSEALRTQGQEEAAPSGPSRRGGSGEVGTFVPPGARGPGLASAAACLPRWPHGCDL